MSCSKCSAGVNGCRLFAPLTVPPEMIPGVCGWLGDRAGQPNFSVNAEEKAVNVR